MAIEIQGESYELKYTPYRIEMIEQTIGKSMMGSFVIERGMLPLSDLKTMFIGGLKKDGGGYILQKTGETAFYQILEEYGYAPLSGMIYDALERDCPFLFREA